MENGHVLRLQPKWFNAIKNGTKTIEGRLLKEKIMFIRIGDTISFNENNSDKFILKTVSRLCVYNTLYDMCSSEKLSDLLPGIATIDEAIKIYESIYTQNQLLTHKLVAIHFTN